MKFENNNKEVIKRITKKSLKTNKVRNSFAIIAVILTTFMISSVFSIGVSFIKNYKSMNIRIQGGLENSSLNNPSENQIKGIKELNLSKTIGYEINAGRVSLDSLSENKTKIILKYKDKENFEKQYKPAISDIEGRYPTKENEVMVSKKTLDLLNKSELRIEDTLEVPIKVNGEDLEKEFLISGVYRDYAIVEDTGYILVSESFLNTNKLTLEKDGSLFIEIKEEVKDSAPDILEKEIKIKDNQEFSFSYDITEDLSDTTLSTVLLLGAIVLFIIFSGYLLIYNVLYIGVNKDINFYGLLKTIGASPKQIKKIVKGQATRLSLVGIPIGLVLGGLVSFLIVPISMGTLFSGSESSAMPTKVSFNPLIFIGATLFSLITVKLSCRKPAKIAGNISPTEALKYTGISVNGRKFRKTTSGGKLYKMAWYNVFRERKRALIVFLSLFMGIVTFLSVTTFLGGVKVQNYIDKYVKQDFSLQNINGEEDRISEDIIEKISNIEGVEEVYKTNESILYLEKEDNLVIEALNVVYKRFGMTEDDVNKYLEDSKNYPYFMSSSVIGIEDDLIDKIYKENKDKFDLEAFKNGELVLLDSWFYGENYKELNEEITIKNPEDGETKNYNAVIIKDDTGLIPPSLPTPLGIPSIYMSYEFLRELDKTAINYTLDINVDEVYEGEINREVKKISKATGLWFDSKSEKTKEFNSSQVVMNVLGGGISIILIFIGVLNFINIMITGVNARLKELAILESIGMTKKQIKRMLTLEGAYYGIITTVITMTVGNLIIYFIGTSMKNIVDYAVFEYPLIQIIIVIILIFVVFLSTPAILFTISSKDTVTERIR